MKKLIINLGMLAGLLLLMAGCGGGGDSATGALPFFTFPTASSTPTPVPPPNSAGTATLTLTASGVPAPAGNLSGITITITLPAGVTVTTNPDGTVAAGVVIPSGLLSAATATSSAVYIPATRTLNITVASTQAAGFGVGQYATVVCTYSGAVPVANSFTLSGFLPADLLLQPVAGLTASYTAAIN